MFTFFRMMTQDMKFQPYDFIEHVTSIGPTCEDLGIPRDDACALSSSIDLLHKPEFKFRVVPKRETDPFSPSCLIPLPSPFGTNIFDSTCFRRRNERERDRVRCVNEGYLKLKQHLPITNKDKRLSKVETLRYAIRYIKHLEQLLDSSDGKDTTKRTEIIERIEQSSETDKIIIDSLEDDLDHSTDTSDYESKYDTSSEIDCSE